MAFYSTRIGYCTNVHAGTDAATIREKLQTYAAAIATARLQRSPDAAPLPVGLWIPASAAAQLSQGDAARDFAQWLKAHHLVPLTVNGFPYDNFHLPVVKHRVYWPAWWQPERLQYTLQLASLLHQLLAEDDTVGSISTLPLGWPQSPADETADREHLARSGENLRSLAAGLQRLEQGTGRRIVVAIEPEPGCLLSRSNDLVRFFARELPDANHRRYIGVCHDVCHAAVMFESQADALGAYARAGILVGKVQISSAIDVPLAEYSDAERNAAIRELAAFAEDRYLHQTGVLDDAGHFRLVEDLPLWLKDCQELSGQAGTDRHLRIHFHVPIFRRTLGHLRSTQPEISRCLAALSGPDAPDFTGQFEVETYAWTVLPEAVVADSTTPAADGPSELAGLSDLAGLSGLAAGIARELDWFESLIHHRPSSSSTPDA